MSFPPSFESLTDNKLFKPLKSFNRLRSVQIVPVTAVLSLPTFKKCEAVRDDRWAESIAVGSLAFVESVKTELRNRPMIAPSSTQAEAYALREQGEAYKPLRVENMLFWNENPPLWTHRVATRTSTRTYLHDHTC